MYLTTWSWEFQFSSSTLLCPIWIYYCCCCHCIFYLFHSFPFSNWRFTLKAPNANMAAHLKLIDRQCVIWIQQTFEILWSTLVNRTLNWTEEKMAKERHRTSIQTNANRLRILNKHPVRKSYHANWHGHVMNTFQSYFNSVFVLSICFGRYTATHSITTWTYVSVVRSLICWLLLFSFRVQ